MNPEPWLALLVAFLAGGGVGGVLGALTARQRLKLDREADLNVQINFALAAAVSSSDIESQMGIAQLKRLLEHPVCTDHQRKRILTGLISVRRPATKALKEGSVAQP